ncbi:molybdopterin biosynthesis protein [Clostridia bacterium]|nr:molybdopterin biosynthesis protein [Clostridia bacterium]
MARRIYLENIELDEALRRWFLRLEESGALLLQTESVDVRDALGRITAEAVLAKRHSPHFLASAMDGIAVKAEETLLARDTNPVLLHLTNQYHEVDTGDPLPEGCNAVIMSEEVHYPQKGVAEIVRPAIPWQHVRPVGEDLTATEMIVPVNHRVGAYDLGGFLAGGVFRLLVRQRPRVAIIPTGTEIKKAESNLKAGDLVEYNSAIFSALLTEWGAIPVVEDIVEDELEQIKQALQKASDTYDVVIINAGSSAGREDFTHQAIEELGEVVVHGLAVKPGKPALLGLIGNTPIVGLPGYPVSATLDCEILVRPLMEAMQQNLLPPKDKIKAHISRTTNSSGGSKEYIRVTLGQVGNKMVATPISRGAGVISSLIKADGLLIVPENLEGYSAGEEVEIELIKERNAILRNIISIGSHDLTQDQLGSCIRMHHPDIRLSSANTGSFGGLMAMRRGETHMAGIHLLDEETGEYNESYVKKYLPDEDIILMNLVYRQQGLMVEKGNPHGIKGIKDMVNRKLSYVNRQKGSGTRILLDHILKQEGLDPDKLLGYDLEEYTHLGVGTAILSGQAMAGLAVYSAAKSLDLGFLPLYEERYDLLLRADFFHSKEGQALCEAVNSEDFARRVTKLGGYSLRDTGKIWLMTGGQELEHEG